MSCGSGVGKIGKLFVFTYGYSLNVVGLEGDDLVRFFHFVGPYLHPSHVTRWFYTLAGLVESVSAGLSERVGRGTLVLEREEERMWRC